MTIRSVVLAGGVLSLAGVAGVLTAQVPDGYFVISSFQDSAAGTLGGLFLVDPRVPGAPVAITGLGPDLTGNHTGRAGANCVTIEPLTGMLLVGEIGTTNVSIELHKIFLAGSTVALDTTITVGTSASSSGGGITQIALLSGGKVLVGVAGLAPAPPLNGAALAIVDLASGSVTPVPGGPTGNHLVNAVAVDRTGTLGYYADSLFGSSAASIYEIPLPGGGLPRLITNILGSASLAVDHRGQILSTSWDRAAPGIWTIDPVANTATRLFVVGSNPNGLMIERATDDIIYVLNGVGAPGPQVHWITRAGADTPLAAVTGLPSGVDVRHDPCRYGQSTSGNLTHSWNVDPNPGGLPRVGDANFAVGLASSQPNSSAGALFGSATSANLQVGGLTLLLEPGNLAFLATVPGTGLIPLPIPADQSLVGGTLFLQTFHADAGGPLGLAASDGLRLTVRQ